MFVGANAGMEQATRNGCSAAGAMEETVRAWT
ncbi:hypothetical protein QG37_05787 [Candidozyma auris]|uniref:Uncharacterized protein n=1 Tax=Candidozyma auris TaxID=498019 RepID=A0A0L0NTB9_CANAR|nr:hypothetical protein QG37_05787 [[Candida] auris]